MPGCGRSYATTSEPRAEWRRAHPIRRVSAFGKVRIIGGRLRGHRLPVLAVAGLRPTPDRVRETVFNWLQGRLVGKRCLDLFAGTGALGLEAASRGAAEVLLIEHNRRLAGRLEALVTEWSLASIRVIHADARDFLRRSSRPFDIVFLDPPFGRNLLPPITSQLVTGGWLAPQAMVYVESEPEFEASKLSPALREWRAGAAGDVRFRLLHRLD